MSDTPISDDELMYSEPHGYSVVPHCVAQRLERNLRDTQAKLDALMLEHCPKEMTQEKREEETFQYYYSMGDCPAISAESERCVCWHDEGTGPNVGAKHNGLPLMYKWRVKPVTLSLAEHRQTEIESLRARNDKLSAEADNERILRYAAEADHRFQQLLADNLAEVIRDWERRSESCESKLGQLEANEKIMGLEAELKAETARCAQVARDFPFSPANGKAIAALITEGRL